MRTARPRRNQASRLIPLMKVLCLDTEGGHGGSSRSLFMLLRHMNRGAVEPIVWCRRGGEIQGRYAEHGVECRVEPDMPRVGALPRLSRNLYAQARFRIEWHRSRVFRTELLSAIKSVDVIHFNLETLHELAHWLRFYHDKAQTMHIRNMPYDTVFGRHQARIVARSVDRLAFITENERDNFAKLAGRSVPGRVIYNVAEPPVQETVLHPGVPRDGRFKVAVLSNYAWVRGTDRVVDVAKALLSRGRRDIAFVMAGDMKLDRAAAGPLRALDWRGATLADYASARGVAEMFVFLGHVAEPESVLLACDAL